MYKLISNVVASISSCASLVKNRVIKTVNNVVASISSCASLVKNWVIKTVKNPRFAMMVALLFVFTLGIMADTAATGGYEAGKTALSSVTEEIGKYIPLVVKLCYAIAGVVAVLGAISVYMAMNNEEQDVKKKIMMVVGACLFLIAAAQALPMFFGF